MNASINISTGYEPENFDDVALWLRVLHGIILAVFLVLSVTGNCAVILMVLFNKKLQYRSIVVSIGLVIADLLVAVLWTLSGLAATIAGEWPLEQAGCAVIGAILLWVLYARWLETAVVTLDRFFIILFPFAYYKHSKPVLITLTIIAWFIPAVLLAIPAIKIFDLGEYRFHLTSTTCQIDCLDNRTCFSLYVGLFATFVIIGGVFPTFIYLIMYCIGRKKRSAMRHRLGTQVESHMSSSSTSATNNEPSPTGNENNTFVRRQTAQLNSRDRRALGTFFIIFVALLVTQIPILVTSILRRNESIPLIIHFISTYIFLTSPALGPIVIMRNKDFRYVIAHITKRHRTIPYTSSERRNGSIQLVDFRRNSVTGLRRGSLQSSGSECSAEGDNVEMTNNNISTEPLETVYECKEEQN